MRACRPLLRPNISVWRCWEVMSRTGGLGLIGVSVLAQGGQVQPPSIILGGIALMTSTYCAFRAGEMEDDDDRIN